MWLLFDVIADIILFYPRTDAKLKYHIAQLSEQEWFRDVHEDTRYTGIIWNNRKIKRLILLPTNMKLLTKSKEKQKELIQIIHSEHKKRR
ncbi:MULTISPECIES: hypothetical protein [Bacillus]|uniref:hypothetical protein n=1 Tax=Bacillus TaxID=1386 RepID=UPI0005349D48|nr:hypothetical protein [Bacillus pseudomycoides]MED1594737.1 hypothetical protein [Bacillus pseudomycoides]MED4711415.1 hypothetical protein [Bacillus pseudomycoides]OOR49386.1 hypothetical protein BLX05_24390 [Bacillus pseudomycoides]PDY12083.1 hypothetical protein COO16_11900 [Bacillus pseudomycoides]PEF73432.1 hypothetical protein CON94_20440 [Bacillus pseudomycoides]